MPGNVASKHKCSDARAKGVTEVMTLEQKILVLDKLECGENVAPIRKCFHIIELSVRTAEQVKQSCRLVLKQPCQGVQKLLVKALVHVWRKVVDAPEDEHSQ